MNCKDAELILVDLIKDEIDSTIKSDLMLHLESCAICSKKYQEYQKINKAIKNSLML